MHCDEVYKGSWCSIKAYECAASSTLGVMHYKALHTNISEHVLASNILVIAAQMSPQADKLCSPAMNSMASSYQIGRVCKLTMQMEPDNTMTLLLSSATILWRLCRAVTRPEKWSKGWSVRSSRCQPDVAWLAGVIVMACSEAMTRSWAAIALS